MKILLAEDTRAVAAVMKARLASYGHDVVHADNGEKAVALFRKECPDLVLMDIDMPVMNGFEATNRIRAIEATQQWAWTPIIFLTATDTEENLITAIEAGGDDFLAKAMPETVLQAKMRAMSRIARLRERLSIANRKLEELASRDGLTGLFNRRQMDLKTDVHWAEAESAGAPFAVLMIDVDNFKKYNDRYGHQVGDDCLRAIADAIQNVVDSTNSEGLTKNAFAARYGGEEFSIVIPGATPAAYEGIAEIVLDAVRTLAIPHEVNASWGIVTISIGGALVNAAKGPVGGMFSRADENLYRAKERGRNGAELD